MRHFKKTGGQSTPTSQTHFPDDSPAQASFSDPPFYPDSQDLIADPGSPSFGPENGADASIADASPDAGATVLGGANTSGTAPTGTTSGTGGTPTTTSAR